MRKFIIFSTAGIILFLIVMAFRHRYTNTEEPQAPDYNNDTINVSLASKPIIDSATIKKLQPLFSFNKDDFDSGTWITPKSAPAFINQNAIYCYFQEINGKGENLRLKFQCHGDNWLFIQQLRFFIDGQVYIMIPNEIKTNVDNDAETTEWFDEQVSYAKNEILEKISTAKVAKIKIIGKDFSEVKTISNSQKISIKNTLALFKAMGGKII